MATTITHTNSSDHSKQVGYLAAVLIAAVAVAAAWQVIDRDNTPTSSTTSAEEQILIDSSGLGDALAVTYDVPVVARSTDPTGLGAALAVDPYRRAGNDPMGLGAVFGVEIPVEE